MTVETKWAPIEFEPPLINPAPQGLFAATLWTEEAGPARWLGSGIAIKGSGNYGGELAAGVWSAPWCASPDDLTEDDLKTGVRPVDLGEFDPVTVWAVDQSDVCDPPSEAIVIARARQVLRLREQVVGERAVAERMLTDAGTPATSDDLVGAVAHLEAEFADTNTVGFIHASPMFAAVAANAQLLVRSGTKFVTPLGHQWVFGGGYRAGLGTKLVGTTQPYGWRNEVQVRTTLEHQWNEWTAVAERSFVVGYEQVVAAVDVTG